MRESIKKHKKLLITAAALLLVSILSFLVYQNIANTLNSQKAAENWRGDSEMEFAQISAFLPADGKLALEKIYEFRNEMGKKFHEAALDIDNDNKLFNDAWSSFAKVNVASDRGKGEVSAIAVGGSFFDFHPIKLLSGSYLLPDDVMQDRALLDEETAWLLFGGTDLQGMTFRINGVPFVVAGVIERESDKFSKKAYTSGMGIYISYDAYLLLDEKAEISCYEVVLAQPVKDFAYNAAKNKFPIGTGELLDNSGRYDAGRLLKMVKNFGSRSMQNSAVIYPYWENAARSSEDWCMALLSLSILTAALPALLLLVTIIRALVRGKNRLEEDTIPRLKENALETIRVRQRRRWEKQHGILPEAEASTAPLITSGDGDKSNTENKE